MIDPGALYDWLEARSIVVMQLSLKGNRDLSREEWEQVYRDYIAESMG